ncbi:MAG: LysR family transcriptional regulator [Oscillospiraceae bacterium]|nr:LysR family transcriptional regulator [Oscillospiraceae bacterium]MBQ8930240.1 LysR family transcriptional regulator [Oscillospiraceae bacterium]
MTFTQMEYVITLAKCLNYTEASRLLYITQPTLSKQISLIEEEVGFRIFRRNNKVTTLTSAGQRFCQGLMHIMQDYETALNNSRQIDRAEIGSLRIGITEFRSLQNNILWAIQKMKTMGYNVDIVSRNLPELEELLIQGNIDLAVRPVQYNLTSPPEYNALYLYEVQNCLVIPEDYPLAMETRPSLADFAEVDLLMVGDQMPAFEQSVRESFQSIGLTPNLKFVETFSDLAVMLASHLGVSILPEEHFLLYYPSLRFLRMPEILPSRIHAVWKKDATNPCIEILAELIRKCPIESI